MDEAEAKYLRFYVRRHGCRREEDRLSSLPDEILINILSRLSINSAASTAVLSHRWRHLWTAVTTFHLNFTHSHKYNDDDYYSRFTAAVDQILSKLTSPVLHVFHLELNDLFKFAATDVTKSWFRQLFRKRIRIRQIIINGNVYNDADQDELLYVPAQFLVPSANSLVILELCGLLKFRFPANYKKQQLCFPYLKKLRLHCLVDVRPWLETLIRSSPLLEHLDLLFDLFYDDSINTEIDDHYCLNVFAPNLKSLHIELHSPPDSRRVEIFIDAPDLIDIEISDCNSYYNFVRNPTRLAKAYISLIPDSDRYEGYYPTEEAYLRQMAKFVAGLSTACLLNLDLDLNAKVNLYSHFNGLIFPVFSNLECLKTTLSYIDFFGQMDMLLSLHYFPNLKDLELFIYNDHPLIEVEHLLDWSAPNSIPNCLISKLKTIVLKPLMGFRNELQLPAFLLSNATVLENLQVEVEVGRHNMGESQQARLWREFEFCRSLFWLPRGSPTCEISYHSMYFKASSNDFNGHLKCQIS